MMNSSDPHCCIFDLGFIGLVLGLAHKMLVLVAACSVQGERMGSQETPVTASHPLKLQFCITVLARVFRCNDHKYHASL